MDTKISVTFLIGQRIQSAKNDSPKSRSNQSLAQDFYLPNRPRIWILIRFSYNVSYTIYNQGIKPTSMTPVKPVRLLCSAICFCFHLSELRRFSRNCLPSLILYCLKDLDHSEKGSTVGRVDRFIKCFVATRIAPS